MSTKWNSQVLGKGGAADFGALLKDEFTVVLLQGKNIFGDMIYCYVKLMLPEVPKLQAALKSDAGFNPSDFGTVVAAGKGEPPEEVKAEIATTYNVLQQARPAAQAAAPTEKKNWDEY